MSSDLQQSLYELEALFKQGKTTSGDVTKKLTKLKVSQVKCRFERQELTLVQLELAQSGLYFAPPTANPDDLAATSACSY